MSNIERPEVSLDKFDPSTCLIRPAPKGFNKETKVRAEGTSIWTSTGHRMFDWTSGQMSCLLGHGHPEIVDTIRHHAEHLDHLFSASLSPPAIGLAKELTSLTPPGLDRALFPSTGGESNEAAIQMAKMYTGKWEIVGLNQSWHGMSGAAQGAQYLTGRRGIGPLVCDSVHQMMRDFTVRISNLMMQIPGNMALPAPNPYRSIFHNKDGSYDWKAELDYGWSLIDRASAGSLACVILEPIMSSAGIIPMPDGYLKAMKAHCEARGMLLILDEAQTAIGRCGNMFAFEQYEIVPDILTLSKTLGNGIALSAVLTSHKIANDVEKKGFLFYTTHLNDPLPCSVGLKVLQIVQRDNLVENSRKVGAKLLVGFQALKERYACIGDVRGRGLLIGVEIVKDRRLDGEAGKEVGIEVGTALKKKLAKLGLPASVTGHVEFGGVFRIAPPILLSEREAEEGLKIFEEALATTEGSGKLY
jgi:4-aminobutyrate aminotransferase-like enzyme